MTTTHTRGHVGQYVLALTEKTASRLESLCQPFYSTVFGTGTAQLVLRPHVSITTLDPLAGVKRREVDLAESPYGELLGTMQTCTVAELWGSKSLGVIAARVFAPFSTEAPRPHITLMKGEGVPAKAAKELFGNSPPEDLKVVAVDEFKVRGIVLFKPAGQPPVTPRILIGKDPAVMAEFLAGYKSATVEWEQGDFCLEGSELTLAHHGPRAGSPCPCLWNKEIEGLETIACLQMDEDTLFGVGALLGYSTLREDEAFVNLVARADLNGPHTLSDDPAYDRHGVTYKALEQLVEDAGIYAPRDGSVLDITDRVHKLLEQVAALLDGDESLRAKGHDRITNEVLLNHSSFVRVHGDVVVRKHDMFANHLYAAPDAPGLPGIRCRGCVALNTTTGGITMSLARPRPGESCRDIVQGLWGPEAGGHPGCAGSPYNRVMTETDLNDAAYALQEALTNYGR